MLWVPVAGASPEPPAPDPAPEVCHVAVDHAPAETLDCVTGGRWTLVCTLPAMAAGKIRVHARMADLHLEAEARVPYLDGPTFELPIGGPGPGAFLATAAGLGLSPGQAVGPAHWCPVAPPGATGERATLPLVFEVVSHQQVGFAEEVLPDGVVNRIPTFDAGTVLSRRTVPVVQRVATPTPALPNLAAAPVEAPLDKPVKGQLQLPAADGVWKTVTFTGRRWNAPQSTGAVRLLVVDLPLAALDAVAGGDPVTFVKTDLHRWYGGDSSALLGLVAWAKADLPPPVPLAWTATGAKTDRVEVSVTKGATAIRVVVGWREAALDAKARAVIADEVAGAP